MLLNQFPLKLTNFLKLYYQNKLVFFEEHLLTKQTFISTVNV